MSFWLKNWWLLLLTALVFHTLLFIGIFHLRFNYFIKSKSNFLKGKALLTFDDGPDENTISILNTLKKHNISAIFFLIGNKIEKSPEIVQKIISEGHFIGNHTYTHANKTAFLSTRKLTEEIKKCQQLIEQFQTENLTVFRPPVGITNPNFNRALTTTGLKSIGWSLRTLDTQQKPTNQLINSVLSKIKNSDIILFHDTMKNTAENLNQIIVQAKKNGINFANQNDIKKWNNE